MVAGIAAAAVLRVPSSGKMTGDQGPRAAAWDETRVAVRGTGAMENDVAGAGEIGEGE